MRTSEILESLDLSEERASELSKLLTGKRAPESFLSVQVWLRECFNRPAQQELIMRAANEILQTHGVEVLWADESQIEPAYSYCNAGDSYATTLCYDHESGEYLLSSWGYLQEKMDASKYEERRQEIIDRTDRDDIVGGMVTVLWGDAWARHCEESRCTNLSGVEISDVMPAPPLLAVQTAQQIAEGIEQANGCTLPELYARAVLAHEDKTLNETGVVGEAESAERFGNCLAWQTLGAGVSWFDDHEDFDLTVPLHEGASYPLQEYAEEHCDECGESASAVIDDEV